MTHHKNYEIYENIMIPYYGNKMIPDYEIYENIMIINYRQLDNIYIPEHVDTLQINITQHTMTNIPNFITTLILRSLNDDLINLPLALTKLILSKDSHLIFKEEKSFLSSNSIFKFKKYNVKLPYLCDLYYGNDKIENFNGFIYRYIA